MTGPKELSIHIGETKIKYIRADIMSDLQSNLEERISILEAEIRRLGGKPPDIGEIDNIEISALRLSTRVYARLASAKIRTVGDIRRIGPEKLLWIRNFGKGGLKEVSNALMEINIIWP